MGFLDLFKTKKEEQLQNAQQPVQQSAAQPTAVIGKNTVLIADDEVYLRDFYTELLQDEGFQTLSATNGQEVINLVSQNHPDVILLDIMMPVMDGNQVIKILSENETTKNIPVIVLTNAGSIENMQSAKLHNAYKFFIKSNVAPDEIIKTVKQAIADPRNHVL